jgi:phosphoribosylformylglycinamidine cyclo-ligase
LGCTIGEALLAVHVSYGPLIQNLLKKFNPVSKPTTAGAIKALAHITGGGFVDNIPRVLPAKCDAVVLKGSWEMPPIFQIIREKGGVDEAELYQVFNMGIGMTVVVDADRADAVLRAIKAAKHPAWILGQITKGSGVCRVE